MKPLLNDICRCYGVGCDKKESCQRFLTIAIDPDMDDKGHAIFRSYSATLIDKATLICDSFLEVVE